MEPKLRILHLEDSETDSELIAYLLAEDGIDCDIRRCDTHEDFVHQLESKECDVIFADCALPGFSGLEALQLARSFSPDVPFIFVSGTMGEETAIEMLRSGATDYVLKQRLSRLGPALKRAIAEVKEKNKTREMEQRLRQAQRLEAVGTLAGGVAHDFNNILTIIKGHASLLPNECQTPGRVREIGSTIDRAAKRGTDLVKQLLAFARKSDGSFTTTDINQRVHEIAGMLREAFPRNVGFELQLQDGLPDIQADPGQVERVIINLATNARDAMPEGGKITFNTRRVKGEDVPFVTADERRHDHLCLKVIDTGIGMDEKTRQHIFEPFYTTKPKGQGTGLGMPVVYGLMQSHNGVVDVWSEPGKGTAVSLYFPIPPAGLGHVEPVEQEMASPVRGSETILAVDDECDVMYFMQIIMETHGYKVIPAGSAEEALEILRERKDEISLLFSDLGLPKMDGFGLSIQARLINPDLKIILSSGYTNGDIRSRMAEMKIDGFLSKPYDTPVLLETLRETLDRKPVPAHLQPAEQKV